MLGLIQLAFFLISADITTSKKVHLIGISALLGFAKTLCHFIHVLKYSQKHCCVGFSGHQVQHYRENKQKVTALKLTPYSCSILPTKPLLLQPIHTGIVAKNALELGRNRFFANSNNGSYKSLALKHLTGGLLFKTNTTPQACCFQVKSWSIVSKWLFLVDVIFHCHELQIIIPDLKITRR